VTRAADNGNIRIVPFRPELAGAFEELNREWIEKFFRIEESDSKVLDHPESAIIGTGGQIFFALDGSVPVGTAAALRVSDGVFELAKMAVRPAHQGRGTGERLAQAVIDLARKAGARVVFLETNSRLGSAIRLYERVGFVHATPPHRSPYARADVYMELHLSAAEAPRHDSTSAAEHPRHEDHMDRIELTTVPVMQTGMLIRRPAAEVYNAFVNPDVTTKFWFTRSSGPLTLGTAVQWEWEMYGIAIPVTAKVLEPDRRIVIEWPGYGGRTTVEWTFHERPDGATFVSISESGFSGTGDELVQQVTGSTGGFSLVLAGLKALFEHGLRLNLIQDRFPDGLPRG
jgi:GNAT superfamily N-acetyltransferase/uncharacterized protein YndB with AHSA1/START domain